MTVGVEVGILSHEQGFTRDVLQKGGAGQLCVLRAFSEAYSLLAVSPHVLNRLSFGLSILS